MNNEIKLLRIPLNPLNQQNTLEENGKNTKSSARCQLLKINVAETVSNEQNASPMVKLFRLPPRHKKENHIIQSDVNPEKNDYDQKVQYQPPRLLDLRTVLELKPRQPPSPTATYKESSTIRKKPLTNQKEPPPIIQNKTPQLIWLPHIHNKSKTTKLLESPKNEKPKKSRSRKREKLKKIPDLRDAETASKSFDKGQQTTPRFAFRDINFYISFATYQSGSGFLLLKFRF